MRTVGVSARASLISRGQKPTLHSFELPLPVQTSIARFLQYLAVERNASDLTIKSYREDLGQLVHYLSESHGATPMPSAITTADLRGYVSGMHEAGYAKTTVSRRLASLRSFFRFGQRE